MPSRALRGDTKRTIRSLSFADALVYNLDYLVPYLLQGVFTERRPWVRFWLAVHRDPGAVGFLGRMRDK